MNILAQKGHDKYKCAVVPKDDAPPPPPALTFLPKKDID